MPLIHKVVASAVSCGSTRRVAMWRGKLLSNAVPVPAELPSNARRVGTMTSNKAQGGTRTQSPEHISRCRGIKSEALVAVLVFSEGGEMVATGGRSPWVRSLRACVADDSNRRAGSSPAPSTIPVLGATPMTNAAQGQGDIVGRTGSANLPTGTNLASKPVGLTRQTGMGPVLKVAVSDTLLPARLLIPIARNGDDAQKSFGIAKLSERTTPGVVVNPRALRTP